MPSADAVQSTARPRSWGRPNSTAPAAPGNPTVAFLEEEGAVQKVEVGDGRSRYERAEPHHDHGRCTDCGRVAELRGACRLVDADQELSRATGFQISRHYLVVTGLCPDCQSR